MGPDTTRNLLSAMIGKEVTEAVQTTEPEPPKRRINRGNQRRKPLLTASEARARDMNRRTNRKRKPRKRSRKP